MPNKRVAPGLAGASLALLALSACVPNATPPAPAPAPPPAPLPPPPYEPLPLPPPGDWQIVPVSPGDWTYRASTGAVFLSEGIRVTIRCQGREILIGAVAQGTEIEIRTSFGVRHLPASHVDEMDVVARLPASDPLLDQMAFSRGRILVAGSGGPPLVVPAWPEIGRVIEDCRGQ